MNSVVLHRGVASAALDVDDVDWVLQIPHDKIKDALFFAGNGGTCTRAGVK